MILNEAEVSRKTFYKYYTDKYELMELYYNDDISEDLIDEYLAVAWLNDCISDYNNKQYAVASGCLIGMENVKKDLPSSLMPLYEEYYKAAYREAKIIRNTESSKEKKKQESYSSGCDDEYNACKYSDPYDFYYWNKDWFINYEEAEEYCEKYQRNRISFCINTSDPYRIYRYGF